jgi:uncharacterized protein (TIGR03437 family)
LPPAGTGPSARFDGTIAYDPAGQQILLFGGRDSGPKNDLWAYSLQRRQWTEVGVAGVRPPARFGHTLLFDPVRRRLIVFGGQASGFFSDVWAFDLTGSSWQQLSRDAAGPSRRYGHSAIYEPSRDRMIVSHGFTNSGRFDDTWAFNFSTNSWQDVSPSGTRPLPRCLHRAVYDAERSQMFLYGGCASGFGPCPLGDLWAFDLRRNQWIEQTAALKPPAREHYGMVFDRARGLLVLFGGRGNALLNDTWEFDPRRGVWREAAVQGVPPRPRSRHESVFAEERGAAFFFGGTTEIGTPTSELWMLGPGFLSTGPRFTRESVANTFSGEGVPVAPGQIVTIYGSGLGPAEGVSFQFDPAAGQLPVSGPGVDVTWNGIPSPLYFARADQLNVQVPYELSGSSEAALAVTVNGQSNPPVTIPIVAARPGLFPRVWNQDGSVNSSANPARSGDVIVLFATGQGITAPPSKTGSLPQDGYPEPVESTVLTLGGLTAEIVFRGQAPGTAGVMQVNARIPQGVAPGNAVPVLLTIGGVPSQTGVTMSIR